MFPFFSIIVPVYNVEQYLPECIKSIIEQSYNNFELILVDDGATDRSGKICDQYAQKDNRIQVMHKTNGGLSDARNKGISLAKGKYLVFVDSDDLLNIGALAMINQIIQKHDEPDIIINRSESFINTPEEEPPIIYSFDLSAISKMSIGKIFHYCCNIKGFWCTAWSVVVKKDYLHCNKIYFPTGRLHEDEHWFPRVVLNAKSVAFNNDCFYKNRVNRAGSLTQVRNIKREFDKLWIIQDLLNESKKDCYDEISKKAIKVRCSQIFMSIVEKINLLKNHQEYYRLSQLLNQYVYVLKYNASLKYKLFYILYLIAGANVACTALNIRGKK